MRFVGYQDRKQVAAALKPIYTAADAKAARIELDCGSPRIVEGFPMRLPGWGPRCARS